MIDRLAKIESPEMISLNEQQLLELRQLCETPYANGERTLLSHLQWYTADIARSPYGGKDSYWPIRSAENIKNNETLSAAYEQLYETDDPIVLHKLFALDLFAWNRLHALSQEYFTKHAPSTYPEDDIFHVDAGYVHDVTTGAQPRYKVPLQYSLNVRRAEDNPDQDPAIIKRLQFGMPRSLQLIGMTLLSRDFGAQTYSASRYGAVRLSGAAEFLQLSDAELQTCVQLAVNNGPSYDKDSPDVAGSKILNSVLTNDKLMMRFQTDSVFDPMFFGGEAALHRSIRATFREVASTNAKEVDDSVMYQWRRLHKLVGADYITQLIPEEERTRQVITAALESLTKNMVSHDILSPELKSMIDPAEFAQACWDVYSFWQANPNDAYKLQGRYEAPVSLRALRLEARGIPNLRPDVLLDRERPCNQLLKQVINNSDAGSEMFKTATERLAATNQYDETLLNLLKQSTDIVNHDDLRVFTDGFDGSEETSQWIQERNANASVLRNKLEALNEQIKQRASQL